MIFRAAPVGEQHATKMKQMTGADKLFDLEGKTALVTGCSAGLGSAMAVALAGAGADIIGVARRDCDEAAAAVKTKGRRFTSLNCDLGDRSSVYRMVRQLDELPAVDILINNAGTIIRKPLQEHDDESWDTVLQVNLHAQFILSREIGTRMLARGSGKIIFICSMLSYQGGIRVPGYTASKSALAGLVKAFSNEWAGAGINVNGIAPGYFATDNTYALQSDPERNKAILDRIPAGRWGSPEDLAGPVVFLSSAAAAYVHGTILNVDGGWMGR